jgi:hypothetical protein
MNKRSAKILVLLLAGVVSIGVLSREANAIGIWAIFSDGVAEVINILPWQSDPPEDECTCPDHDQCMGGMHGEGECEPDCPMEMECGMMGDCHGGGAPLTPETQKK